MLTLLFSYVCVLKIYFFFAEWFEIIDIDIQIICLYDERNAHTFDDDHDETRSM